MAGQTSPDYYCVFNGWIPGIYTSLEELLEQINEFDDCCWEKYQTLALAEQAWLSFFGGGDAEEGKRRIQLGEAPDAVETDDYRDKQRLALRALHARFHQFQYDLANNPERRDLVPETPPNEPLLHQSMRSYLAMACEKLDIPGPIYRILNQRYPDGCTCYQHLVSVVPPSSFEALVVIGPIAFNPTISIEDAARLCIREICKKEDCYVLDYNYDLVGMWKQKYIQLCKETCTLKARLKDVTDSKVALQERIFTIDGLRHGRCGGQTSNR
ncbi:uncharacterized protein LOC107620062 [Arachis ipaensis]|uniref:uncharacterized protein LOC107620062 n=1 Tax=Arachis ipaensis TaxID=130454 RepID=UPI0007AF7925|nr:uncharacterized protein LOC107620062 [Arachis ipaensis]XP_025682928.1 uncharacterized protein LOC112784047 [Arachis hypogaea]